MALKLIAKKNSKKEAQLKNIVDEILPLSCRFPQIQADTFYMLLELNIEHEVEGCEYDNY